LNGTFILRLRKQKAILQLKPWEIAFFAFCYCFKNGKRDVKNLTPEYWFILTAVICRTVPKAICVAYNRYLRWFVVFFNSLPVAAAIKMSLLFAFL